MILSSVWGNALPTVVTRRSTGSFVVVMVTPGLVSVWPYTITISLMCIRVLTSFITSIGQGEPAMMPVRRDVRLYFAKFGWVSSAMNIVGTPWSAVHFSFSTVFKTSSASKAGPGRTMVEPWVTQARLESTMPKQW